MQCPKCQTETEHEHLHNAAHGIPGTHMAGSERYECIKCGYVMRKEEAEAQNLKFVCD